MPTYSRTKKFRMRTIRLIFEYVRAFSLRSSISNLLIILILSLGDIAFHEQITEFKQHSRSHIRVPVHFADAPLHKVETYQLSAACQYFGEEICYFLRLETARHRSSRIGTKLAVKSIDIETDVYLL